MGIVDANRNRRKGFYDNYRPPGRCERCASNEIKNARLMRIVARLLHQNGWLWAQILGKGVADGPS